MIEVELTEIPDVKLLAPRRIGDDRGFFSEVYNKLRLADCGITCDFVQDNHSRSALTGTIRGLHFQAAPSAQAKLIRVARGSILDVAVDIRRASPTYGKHVAVALSAENWRQLFIPAGFAHGFCTLEPDCEVIYKVDAYYDPAVDFGLAYNDPDLGIAWPVASGSATLSDKDRNLPKLRDLPDYF